MKIFGKIDENNMVLSVSVVNEKDTSDENGQIVESIGQAFCESITGWPAAQWVMESEDKRNAIGVGMEWDPANKIFWTPQPYPSWTKDIERAHWISPVGMPPELTEEQKSQHKHWAWDKENQEFKLITMEIKG